VGVSYSLPPTTHFQCRFMLAGHARAVNLPLSDTLWLLLQPSTVVLLLLVLSLLVGLLRRRGASRLLLFAALLLMVLPAVLPLRALLAQPLEGHVPPAPLPERVDGIIVLGGAVEWRVSKARGQLAVNEAAERLMAAAALAQRYPQATLVFTGLFAETAPQEFRPQATPQSFFSGPAFANRRIIYLGAARSTFEDALLSQQALSPQAGQTWLLVTSAMHMPRAIGTFQTLSWRVLPYPVDYRTAGLEPSPTLNIIGELAAFDQVVREWGAIFIYHLLGRTQTLLPRF